MRPLALAHLGRPAELSATLLLVISAVATPADASYRAERQADKAVKLPPWQRDLVGDDATHVVATMKQVVDLEKKGQFDEAVGPAKEVFELRRRVQGDDHWETINARFEWETVTRVAAFDPMSQSEVAAARRAFDEAQELYQRGRYAEAEPLLRKVVDVRRRLLGEKDPGTCNGHHELAFILSQQGQFEEAETLYRKVIALRGSVLGEDHPETAAACNSFAAQLNIQGRHTEAEPLLLKALATKLRVLGENDISTAASYNNLARCFNVQGKFGEAEQLHRRTLAICRLTVGPNDPRTTLSLHNLALNLREQGKYEEAGTLFQQALASFRRLRGERHPDLVRAYMGIAGNLALQGHFVEAETPLRNARIDQSGLAR